MAAIEEDDHNASFITRKQIGSLSQLNQMLNIHLSGKKAGWSGGAKVSCSLHHRGVQLILAYSWARPATLVAGKGRGGMFLFLLFLHFHSCSPFFPVPLPSPLLSILSLFSLFLGDDTNWPTRVDVSLNPNTIKKWKKRHYFYVADNFIRLSTPQSQIWHIGKYEHPSSNAFSEILLTRLHLIFLYLFILKLCSTHTRITEPFINPYNEAVSRLMSDVFVTAKP